MPQRKHVHGADDGSGYSARRRRDRGGGGADLVQPHARSVPVQIMGSSRKVSVGGEEPAPGDGVERNGRHVGKGRDVRSLRA